MQVQVFQAMIGKNVNEFFILQLPENFFKENDTPVFFTKNFTLQSTLWCRFFCNFQCNSMLFCLNTITVMYISPTTGMLYGDKIFYARRSRAIHELRRSESKMAKLEELSNNISERRAMASRWVSETNERAGMLRIHDFASGVKLVVYPEYTTLLTFK